MMPVRGSQRRRVRKPSYKGAHLPYLGRGQRGFPQASFGAPGPPQTPRKCRLWCKDCRSLLSPAWVSTGAVGVPPLTWSRRGADLKVVPLQLHACPALPSRTPAPAHCPRPRLSPLLVCCSPDAGLGALGPCLPSAAWPTPGGAPPKRSVQLQSLHLKWGHSCSLP